MSFDDRRYGSPPDGGFGSMPLWLEKVYRFLNFTFPIGTYLNTAVRVHILFIFLLIYLLLVTGDVFDTLRIEAVFFFSVLLHEFGHVLGCRSVGGHADRILMWPLGGLAFCDAPRRPWAEFVTVACGPLVTLGLVAGSFVMLAVMLSGSQLPSFNPLALWQGGVYDGLAGLVTDVFYVNYLLLLFNLLLLFYPFDGGRLVQVALWTQLGYQRSMRIATVVGMVGAVAVAFFGIMSRQMMLIFIAVFGFIACYQQSRALRLGGGMVDPYGNQLFDGESWKAGDVDGGEREPGFIARWVEARAERKAERQRQAEAAEQAEVDRILAKVHNEGIGALTDKEKRTLNNATQKQRNSG